MSWQTADLVSADTTDVLAADTTNVLPADTTHVLPADNPGFLWILAEGQKSCNPKLEIFAGQTRKACFSPRGSVWDVEGGVLLSISLGLAVCTFGSDL